MSADRYLRETGESAVNTDRYRVQPDDKVDLADWDPRDKKLFDGDKEAGRAATAILNARLEELQEMLWLSLIHI